MTTDAPSRASAQPIAKPIPAVDPVTKAFFPSSCKFIASFFSRCVEKLSNPKAFEAEISFREEHRSGDLCAHRLLSLCSMSLLTWFTISRGQIGGSTILYFG